MTIYFSKTTGGFYNSDIPAARPSDAVEVSEEEHAALLAAQLSGKAIQGDSNGNPVAVNQPAPSSDQLHAALVFDAQTALNKSDVTIIRCVSAGVTVPAAWQTYRVALRAIVGGTDTVSTALPTRPAYPSGT